METYLRSGAILDVVTLIETLGALGQKQRARFTLEDGSSVEARINQSIYAPDENLRLELAPDDSDAYQRYQVRARVEDGTWTAPLLRGYEQDEADWTDLGEVTDVTPLETYGTTTSEDMEAQEETGTEE